MSFSAAFPFLNALGWTLLHSLWQFAVCWLIWRTLTDSIKKLTAAAKHTIALLLLLAGTLSFVAGLSWKYYADATAGAVDHSIPVVTNTYYYTIWHTAGNTMDAIIPYWSLLYLICVLFLFIKFCVFVQRAGSLQNNGNTKMNAVWRTYVKNVSARLGIQKEVKALLSVHIDTPQVIGFFKPVILLPAACLVNLSTEQLEAVLLHELVHIKRNDYIINLFVTSAEILFFFNPFVKQLTAGIRKEREYSCDDMVMQFQYQPHNYASALLVLEKSRMLPITYGIAASGKNQQQLLTRIERIMGIENRQTGFYRLGACLMALLLLGFIATTNPARVAVDNFGEANLALAFTDFNTETQQTGNEKNSSIANTTNTSSPVKEHSNPAMDDHAPVHVTTKNKTAETNQLVDVDDDTDNNTATEILTAAHRQTMDFSLPPKDEPVVPAAPELSDDAAPGPYVPANSFSFQVTQDTLLPKMKGETYPERMAKDARLKTQKALEQINWQKIEKQLNYSQRDIARLKNEIVVQLQKLNWQKINSEVKTDLIQQPLQMLQNAVKHDLELKQYQQYLQNEAYQEALTRQLTEQGQLIRDAGQKLEESRKATELQHKKAALELKKRRIIYI